MTASLLEQLADLPKAEVDALIRAMAPGEANAFEYDWRYRARPEQLPPAGSWRVWLLMAGRGFGKTRSGAEWVRAEVKTGRRRIALVGPTAADARNVMVEGASGILAISPDRERPLYEPSKRRLTWPNGAVAATYSADEPERLRGPQHDAAWCDELAAWRYPEAWTPRPAKLIRDLVRDPICVVTRGSSYENRGNLAPAFFDQIIRKYEGTRLGRQELEAELLEDTPGALWSHGSIEASRLRSAPAMTRVVVAIDPAVTSGEEADETGIIVAGKDHNGEPREHEILRDRGLWLARQGRGAGHSEGGSERKPIDEAPAERIGEAAHEDRGDASHGRPKRSVYRGPRLARQGGAGRTGGGALRAGPRPSHRHLPATRRPDDKFYIGYRPRRGGVFAGPR